MLCSRHYPLPKHNAQHEQISRGENRGFVSNLFEDFAVPFLERCGTERSEVVGGRSPFPIYGRERNDMSPSGIGACASGAFVGAEGKGGTEKRPPVLPQPTTHREGIHGAFVGECPSERPVHFPIDSRDYRAREPLDYRACAHRVSIFPRWRMRVACWSKECARWFIASRAMRWGSPACFNGPWETMGRGVPSCWPYAALAASIRRLARR
jgi:hypothetical protein